MAAGDVVNTAARLQAAAPVNGVLVGETTYRATRDVIEYRGARAGRRRRARPSRSRSGRRVAGALAARHGSRAAHACAARRPRARARRARRRVRPRARRIASRSSSRSSACPGIGKSRLVGELFPRVERSRRSSSGGGQGRALPYGDGVSFWALGEMVKAQAGHPGERHAGGREREARAKRRSARSPRTTRLGRAAPACRSSAVAQPTRAATAGRELRGMAPVLRGRSPSSARSSSSSRTCTGPTRGCSTSSTTSPTGRPACRSSSSARRGPELLDRRPGWGGGKLNVDDARADAARRRRGRADHPRASSSRRCCRPRRSRRCSSAPAGTRSTPSSSRGLLRSAAPREDLPLPETIQGIIAARLDGLEPRRSGCSRTPRCSARCSGPAPLRRSRSSTPRGWSCAALARAQGPATPRAALSRRRRGRVRLPPRARPRRRLRPDPARGARREARRAPPPGSRPRPGRRPRRARRASLRRGARARDRYRRTSPRFADRARVAFRRAGDRALRSVRCPAAERFYADALASWPDDDERPHLALRARTSPVPCRRRRCAVARSTSTHSRRSARSKAPPRPA